MAPDLLAMLRASVSSPGQVAERLLALRPRPGVLAEAVLLVAILDVLVAAPLGTTMAMPGQSGEVAIGPFAQVALFAAVTLLSASSIQVGGRVLGGQGTFRDALVLGTWLQVIALAFQAVVVALALVAPPLAGVASLVALGVVLWCTLHFVRALHRFDGLGRALVALLLGALLVGLALSVLLVALGLGPAADA